MTIYLIRNLVNGKWYVGKTKRLVETRWSEHLKQAFQDSPALIHRAIRKYGHESFSIEVLLSNLPDDFTLDFAEILAISLMRQFSAFQSYNLANGGQGGGGARPDVALRNIQLHKGVSRPLEACRRIAAALANPVIKAKRAKNMRNLWKAGRFENKKIVFTAKMQKACAANLKKGAMTKGGKHTASSKEKMSIARKRQPRKIDVGTVKQLRANGLTFCEIGERVGASLSGVAAAVYRG